MEYRFNVIGTKRKQLVGAISELLSVPMTYLGAPTFKYEIGSYAVDKAGTVTGDYDADLLAALAEWDFVPEVGDAAELPEGNTAQESAESAKDIPGAEPIAEPNRLTIEMPLDGFTPESLENLAKLVASKAPLIMTALGAEELPIQQTADTLRFPWFRLCGGDKLNAYAQFIAALCKTAKEKKRVVVKRKKAFENPRFTMRVWLIGLGMIGEEFKLAGKLLVMPLEGNSAWRYAKQEEEVTADA